MLFYANTLQTFINPFISKGEISKEKIIQIKATLARNL